jgi:G:T-mismatch repair DNA endonuclease (very short patch repair protein)
MRRDRRVAGALRREGWKVIRIKECSVRKPSAIARILKALGDRSGG